MRKISSVPVVMYSGTGHNVADCYNAGADHFLRKPQTLEAIMAIIGTLETCMSFNPPRFGFLARLPEYEPNGALAAAQVMSRAASFA